MHPYVKLAKRTVELWVTAHRRPEETGEFDDPIFKVKRACFCTIYKNNQLRGCIGTIVPCYEYLFYEIIENAISAATRDPRFPPVEVNELKWLEYKVDVLSEISRVSDISSLDPKVNGIIVKQGFKQGLLLPDLDGIDTVEEQVKIAKMKAGIFNDDACEYFTFTVERYA